jgi:hypothetical protein
VQPNWVNGARQAQWAAGTVYQVSSPPVERKPARLVLRQQPGMRSLRLTSTNKFEMFLPDDEKRSVAVTMNADMEETVQDVDARGASVVLRYTGFRMGIDPDEAGARQRKRLQKLVENMPKLRVVLRVDPSGNLLENKVESEAAPESARESLEGMNEQIQHSLEALAVPLPNGDVQAGQQWKAWRDLPIGTPGKFEAGAVDMTYTYLGRRRNGANRDEAVLALDGVVHGRKGEEASVGGQASGTALIDLETGQLSLAKITVKVDMDTSFLDQPVKAVGTLEVRLERGVP